MTHLLGKDHHNWNNSANKGSVLHVLNHETLSLCLIMVKWVKTKLKFIYYISAILTKT